jgi:RNase H-fold protein (predicted Holliday junction resolvase)
MLMKEFIPNHEKGDTILVSDASEVKAFAYNLTKDSTIEVEVNFSDEEKKLSSAARELLALDYTIRHWKVKGYKNMRLYWATDSSISNLLRKRI